MNGSGKVTNCSRRAIVCIHSSASRASSDSLQRCCYVCVQHTIALPVAIVELRAFGPHALRSRARSLLLLFVYLTGYLAWVHYVAARSGVWPYELFQGASFVHLLIVFCLCSCALSVHVFICICAVLWRPAGGTVQSLQCMCSRMHVTCDVTSVYVSCCSCSCSCWAQVASCTSSCSSRRASWRSRSSSGSSACSRSTSRPASGI